MRISDWSSDVCSSDLAAGPGNDRPPAAGREEHRSRRRRRACRRHLSRASSRQRADAEGGNGLIASLKGLWAASAADHGVIDVGGVGYLVLASARTLSLLGAFGDAVSVQTAMQVREESITRFGFARVGERGWLDRKSHRL